MTLATRLQGLRAELSPEGVEEALGVPMSVAMAVETGSVLPTAAFTAMLDRAERGTNALAPPPGFMSRLDS